MKKTVATLTVLLVLSFMGMTFFGGYLVYQEIPRSDTSTSLQNESSDLKVEVSNQSASFEIKNAIPGIIFLAFGGIGLISMVFRLPVKEVLGYQTKGGGNGGMGFMVKEKVMSPYIINVPYPVWLLLKPTGHLDPVSEGA